MNHPRNSISSCSDFHKKFVRQFAGSKHIQVKATSLFSIRQGVSETLREYLARFSEETIKVSNPNQEMFVAAFQNGLKAGYFNESLAQKPTESMQETAGKADSIKRTTELQIATSVVGNPEKEKAGTIEGEGLSEIQKEGHARPMKNTPRSTAPRYTYCTKSSTLDWRNYPQHKKSTMVETAKQEDTEAPLESPQDDKGKETARVAVNTIAGGFAGGGESNLARKRYLRGIIDATNNINHAKHTEFPATPNLSFSPRDASGIVPHDDDPLVIQLSSEQLQPYHGTLVGFTGDQAEVMGHITLLTTFGERDNTKTVKVRYLVVRTPFTSYNIIIGRPAFNALGAAMSTLYLSIKYLLDNGGVGILRGNQAVGRQCYESSLKIKKKLSQVSISQAPKEAIDITHMCQTADLDPREEFQEGRVSPTEELEEIKIGDKAHQVTNLGTTLPYEERGKIIPTLRKNVDIFAWRPKDIPGIDDGIITHKLAIMPNFKPVSQKKRKLGEERRGAVDEEVAKLKAAHFIEEIKYPEWLANVVMVKKNNGKLKMCVDFTDLNKACPKDPYPLPSIDRLIDGASGCNVVSFMDAYSGYNQIKMNLPDAPHTAFMTNNRNYFYKVMSFGLKNAGATYQRLMDRIFSRQIGRNLEVYIDDMVVKTTRETSHDVDLEEILAEVRGYNMRLNPAKCSFGVQAGKFLGFMLTSRGIEANPDKCQAIINMRSSTSVKEVQQLTEFLASPPILTRPIQGTPLHLYLAVSENAMSSALVQEINGEEKPVYFFSRTFRGAETRYQKIKRLSLAVIVTARRLRQYFQSHKIVVKSDFPIKQVLKKPDLAGRMIAWSVELLEYDITFSPRGSIKSQVLADFVLEMTTPPEMASTQPWTLSVDGASNLRGSGAGIVLEGPNGVLIEQSLRFAFKASNNQAEYEALIAGMKLAKEMEVLDLKAKSDSQLVTNQVSSEYQTKDPQLMRYLEKVRGLAEQFDNFELIHVPRDQNSKADLLSKLASTKKPGNNKTVIQETISKPSTEMAEVTLVVEQSDWRLPIIQYLKRDILPVEKEDAARIKKITPYYTLIGEKLYKRGFSSPLLLCVSTAEAQRILNEIHDGSCGNHIGARSLAGKVTRAGYFWPTLLHEATKYIRSCDKCQRFADLHHAPGEAMQSVMAPWPFYMWGVDIVGPFTASQGQVKFLLVAVDYFTNGKPGLTGKSKRVSSFQGICSKADKGGKLAPNWEGPFRIQEAFGGGAYKLETLKGETLPRTWNVANLKFYFS
ncbi:hypothetical protein TSUD_393000 [Trifolium subterraneum]|uniref:RNase H type-1 domain-containing protein n=1 Tax=Trifolium subterraneum TaxID=3900 RepID=A0A2Z6N4T7_TRISU|nr:hypothetical protein TSUD_393000 [Trifolium subterraneum]